MILCDDYQQLPIRLPSTQAFPILYEPKQITNLIEFRNTIHLLPKNLTSTQSKHRKFCTAFLNDATVKWETYDVFVVLAYVAFTDMVNLPIYVLCGTSI